MGVHPRCCVGTPFLEGSLAVTAGPARSRSGERPVQTWGPTLGEQHSIVQRRPSGSCGPSPGHRVVFGSYSVFKSLEVVVVFMTLHFLPGSSGHGGM